MTSQPDLQSIAIHNLPNTSQNKDNQTMKFGQLIEYNNRNIFLQNYVVPDLFLLFKKALSEVKSSGLQLSFSIFR